MCKIYKIETPKFMKVILSIFSQFKLQKPNYAIISLWSCAFAYVILAIIGAVRYYSIVPLGDTYALSEFSRLIADGDFTSFWEQYNEHRIVLTRILFWLDNVAFGSTNIFLICANYLCAFSAFVVFFLYAKENLEKREANIVGALILILVFFWSQQENLTWEFQSKFFLAQLLPLLAFYLLHRSHQTNSVRLFIAACCVGVLSLGGMANGILALPLLTLLALALRMKPKFIISCAILSALALSAYFHNYHANPRHGSMINALLYDPMGLFKFITSYLGNPLRYFGRTVPGIAGFFMIISSAYLVLDFIRNPKRYSSLQLSLLAFVIYVEITAAGTAGGRLIFGIGQSFTGRYTTPTLMAWSALLIIFAPYLATKKFRQKISYLSILAVILPIALLPKQLEALKSHRKENFERTIAALAIKMGVKDEQSISVVCPGTEVSLVVNSLKTATESNWGIFGKALYRDAAQSIGTQEPEYPTDTCLGNVEEVSRIANDTRYFRIKGWLFDDHESSIPKSIRILDTSGEVVGYALTGQRRKEIAERIGKKAAMKSGFSGFFLAKALHDKVILKGLNPDCELEIPLPPLSEK